MKKWSYLTVIRSYIHGALLGNRIEISFLYDTAVMNSGYLALAQSKTRKRRHSEPKIVKLNIFFLHSRILCSQSTENFIFEFLHSTIASRSHDPMPSRTSRSLTLWGIF